MLLVFKPVLMLLLLHSAFYLQVLFCSILGLLFFNHSSSRAPYILLSPQAAYAALRFSLLWDIDMNFVLPLSLCQLCPWLNLYPMFQHILGKYALLTVILQTLKISFSLRDFQGNFAGKDIASGHSLTCIVHYISVVPLILMPTG